MLFRKACDRLQYYRLGMIFRPALLNGTHGAERVYMDERLASFPPHAKVVRMDSWKPTGRSDEVPESGRHRLKTENLSLREFVQIAERRLPHVCAYIEYNLDAIAPQTPPDIKKAIDAMRQTVSINSAAADSLDGLFGALKHG
jgi:hypothetical protein